MPIICPYLHNHHSKKRSTLCLILLLFLLFSQIKIGGGGTLSPLPPSKLNHFQYGLPEDVSSKGQKPQGGGVYSAPPPLIRWVTLIQNDNFLKCAFLLLKEKKHLSLILILICHYIVWCCWSSIKNAGGWVKKLPDSPRGEITVLWYICILIPEI